VRKTYPLYKDSGIEWIGDVPNHWKLKKSKFTSSGVIGGIWGNEPVGDKNDFNCIRVNDFDYERLTLKNNNFTLRNIPFNSNEDQRILRKNDLLIEKSGGGEKTPVGRVIIYENKTNGKCVCSNFISVLRPNLEEYNAKFLVYYHSKLYSDNINTRSIKQTTGIQNIDISSYLDEKIALPCISEQKKIVKYLDYKTQLIDKLIEITKKKIELLKEKRTALIDYYVTKGLNPDVELKDSEVEWIGEIPKHWKLIRCSHLFKIKSIKNTENEINLSVYRDYGVIPRDSRDDNFNRISDDISNYKLVEIGDFVFNKMKCWMGSLGVSEYRGIVSPSYTVCETTKEFDRKYIHYLLRSTNYIQEYERNSYGVRVGQWELHFHDFKNIIALLPPLEEQSQISKYLNKNLIEIDKIIKNETKRIKLLKEYRKSLISEVVTGKIDVRDEVIE